MTLCLKEGNLYSPPPPITKSILFFYYEIGNSLEYIKIITDKPVISKVSYDGGYTFIDCTFPIKTSAQEHSSAIISIEATEYNTQILSDNYTGSNAISGPCVKITGNAEKFSRVNCYQALKLVEFNVQNTHNITDMENMFYDCENLTTISLDTSSVTNMRDMFDHCKNLTSIPQLDTSKVTNMGAAFANCPKLATIPKLNTSNVVDMSSMFSDCYGLVSIPQLDTSKVTDMSYMFYCCRGLTQKPDLIIQDGCDTYNMYYGTSFA